LDYLASTHGQLQRTLRGHVGLVRSAAISPNGRFVASGSRDDGTIRLWDIADGGRCLREIHIGGAMDAPFRDTMQCCFSPCGTYILSSAHEQNLQLWEAETGTLRHLFVGHGSLSITCTFAPSGLWVACGNTDASLIVYATSAIDGRPGYELVLEGHHEAVLCCCFSKDSTEILSGSIDKTLILWEFESGAMRKITGHTGDVLCCCFNEKGTFLASGSSSKTLLIHEKSTGQVCQRLIGHSDWVTR
jgi:WD40 repeat protein